MTEKQDKKIKAKIVSIVYRSGIGMGAQGIQESLSLSDGVYFNTLLAELVTEGRLTCHATLLNNGEVSHMYNVLSAV